MTENDRIEGSKDALPEVLLVCVKCWLLIWYVRFAYCCFNVLCFHNLYISRALFHIRQSHSVSDYPQICKIYSKINHFRPSNLLFTSVFLPFCGGKNAIGGTFLVLREPNSTNHFAKNHFFSLPLFRPDNAIFHNIDNISIFCKILKICKICGYWV